MSTLKYSLIVIIVLFQAFFIFYMDNVYERALVSKHIGLECGKVYMQGVDDFLLSKANPNKLLFLSSLILAVLALRNANTIESKPE